MAHCRSVIAGSFKGWGRALALGGALAACVLATVAASVLATTAHGQAKVRLGTTGNHSELLTSVPVTRRSGEAERVAMSIGPEEMPRLHNGDSLDVVAEVQVSTTCLFRGPRCVGRRYRFNPYVRARVVLAAGPEPTDAAIALASSRGVRCKQRRPNRNHHCVLTFADAGLGVVDLADLPCAPTACYVNLIVGADHRKARRGNRVVLGGDRPHGLVSQDKGRLSAVVSRSDAPAPVALFDGDLRATGLPVRAPHSTRWRVVHSVPLPGLERGEIVTAAASFRAAIRRLRFKRRRYNALLSSRLILAESAGSVDASRAVKSFAPTGAALTEGNGFNCTQGRSGYRTPCLVEKAGAIRMRHDAVGDDASPRTLHLNLVSRAKPLLSQAKRKQKARLRAFGGLTVVRYSP